MKSGTLALGGSNSHSVRGVTVGQTAGDVGALGVEHFVNQRWSDAGAGQWSIRQHYADGRPVERGSGDGGCLGERKPGGEQRNPDDDFDGVTLGSGRGRPGRSA